MKKNLYTAQKGRSTTGLASPALGLLRKTNRPCQSVFRFIFVVLMASFFLTTPEVHGQITFTSRTTADGLGHNSVFGVIAVGSNVYAATLGGLSVSSDGGASFTNRTTVDGLGANLVRGVFAVGSNVYAATNGGLSVSSDGGASFTNRTTADGLGGNSVQEAFAVGSNVYAGTIGGLSASSDGGASFINSTTADGLGNNLVLGVFASGSNVYAATIDGGLSIGMDSNLVTVPTLSEWGLVILALLILTVGTLGATVPAMACPDGQTVRANISFGNLPFDRQLYFKVLPVLTLGTLSAFGVAATFFGYEMTAADPLGSLVAVSLGSYLIVLLLKDYHFGKGEGGGGRT